MTRSWRSRGAACLVALTLAGCATIQTPYVGQGPHPQITRGRPVALVDAIGVVFSIPAKILLWHWKVERHAITSDTEGYLVNYIDAPETVTDGTQYALNQYAPGRDLKRLRYNRKVAWPYRLLIGLPVTLIFDVLLPGRLFGGDRYNPFTDTVQIYSDLPAVALHEAGHSHDFNKRRFKGTYALLRLLPPVTLWQEYKASKEAVTHLAAVGKDRERCSAHEILQPAFGSYVGSYIPFPATAFAGAAVGHVTGRMTAHDCRNDLQARERSQESPPPPIPPVAP
ncbi:MAG: hypothetical protein HYT90_04335 [Candidatus Omnitrophica bacterium]|nr:hypothetical protein [Candidatus Omnitrophota bacterium]